MTRRDYALIARVIQQVHRESRAAHAHTSGCVCLQMAYALQGTNPHFDRERFLVACLPPEEACEKFTGRGPYCKTCNQPRGYHG